MRRNDRRISFKSTRRGAGRLLAMACMLASVGCVERTITITSEPSGALVHLNDEEVGRTPLTVPFTFYGVYDVRLEMDPVWLNTKDAADRLGVTPQRVDEMITQKQIESRKAPSGETMVKVWYRPLWTSHKAKAPWWEAPGPDLLAEAVPDNKVPQAWHFKLEATEGSTPETVLDRAKQLRASVRQSHETVLDSGEEK